MKKHILVVDDDTRILLLLERILNKQGYEVTTCADSQEAISYIKNQKLDLIVCDLALEKMDGIKLLEIGQKYSTEVPFIIITGFNSVAKAVECLHKGAFDYIVKPFDKEQLLHIICRAMNEALLKIPQKPESIVFENIIGQSKKMQEVFKIISQIADTSATVLIQGESGTGKELIAKAIHELSSRKNDAFIAVNCGTLSENLLENELFGHVQGAFTGAIRYKKGLLVEADKGTLFLDEISETPLSVQTKLLRVLQEKEFKPLGSNENIHVDVRIITATNLNLQDAIRDRHFREDLYYRLAVIPIFIPPLRERKEDIPLLAMHFAKKYGHENNKEIEYIEPGAIEKLLHYTWPGNVRQLENTIARAVALATGKVITDEILWYGKTRNDENEDADADADVACDNTKLKDMLQLHTHSVILKTLETTRGNRSKAARILGISRASLYNKIKKYRLPSKKNRTGQKNHEERE